MEGFTGTRSLARLAPAVLLVGLLGVASAIADAPAPPSASAAAPGCAGRGPARSNGRIVVRAERSYGYPGSGEKLFSVRPDGSGRRVLTRPKRSDSDMTVEPAPDGRRVAMVRHSPGRASSMKIVRLSTGRTSSLLREAQVIPTAPVAWSPDGKLLAFTENFDAAPAPGFQPALRLAHPDGSSLHTLSSTVSQARWSRNGHCLVGYTESGVGVISSSGGVLQAFPRPYPWTFGLTFTPNGRRLIFHAASGSTTTDRPGIYSSDLDGTDRRKLVGGTRGAVDPVVVSPDGRLLAYPDRKGTLVRPIGGGPARRLLKGLYIMAWAPARSR